MKLLTALAVITIITASIILIIPPVFADNEIGVLPIPPGYISPLPPMDNVTGDANQTVNSTVTESATPAPTPVVTAAPETPHESPEGLDQSEEPAIDGYLVLYAYMIITAIVIVYIVHDKLSHGKDDGVN